MIHAKPCVRRASKALSIDRVGTIGCYICTFLFRGKCKRAKATRIDTRIDTRTVSLKGYPLFVC